MKAFCVFVSLLCAWILAAQTSTSTYSRDINGRRVYGTDYATDGKGGESKLYRNVNGRQVPLQQSSERVVSQDARSRTTERIVRNFDRDGRLLSTDRIVVEETKGIAGTMTTRETQYRTESTGQTREVERRTINSRTQGQTTNTDITVDRPSPNGGFVTAERRAIVATGPENRRQTTETVSVASVSGSFVPERRDETIVTTQGNQTVTNTATYQPDANQRLALAQQTVSTATERPNGQTVTETNIYGTAMAGRVYRPGEPLHIVEQRIVTQTVAADGTVTELLQTRQPSLAEPNRLGAPQFVAETVCVGKCKPAEEAAPVQQAKATAPKADAKGKDADKGKDKGNDKGKDTAKSPAPSELPNEPKETAAAKAPAIEAKAGAPTAAAAPKGKAAAPKAAPTPAELNPPMPPPRRGDVPLK